MAQATVKVYLIAGATRGMGFALVADIVSKDPSAVVYAGARDPSAPGASKLNELAGKYPGRIEVVKYVSGDKEGNNAIAKTIGEKYGHVDTVIANAAIAKYMGKTHETPIHEYQEHFSVRLLSPLQPPSSTHHTRKIWTVVSASSYCSNTAMRTGGDLLVILVRNLPRRQTLPQRPRSDGLRRQQRVDHRHHLTLEPRLPAVCRRRDIRVHRGPGAREDGGDAADDDVVHAARAEVSRLCIAKTQRRDRIGDWARSR